MRHRVWHGNTQRCWRSWRIPTVSPESVTCPQSCLNRLSTTSGSMKPSSKCYWWGHPTALCKCGFVVDSSFAAYSLKVIRWIYLSLAKWTCVFCFPSGWREFMWRARWNPADWVLLTDEAAQRNCEGKDSCPHRKGFCKCLCCHLLKEHFNIYFLSENWRDGYHSPFCVSAQLNSGCA